MKTWIIALSLGLLVVGCAPPYPPYPQPTQQPQQPIIVNPPAQNNYYHRPAPGPYYSPAPRVYVNPWPYHCPPPHCPPPHHHHR